MSKAIQFACGRAGIKPRQADFKTLSLNHPTALDKLAKPIASSRAFALSTPWIFAWLPPYHSGLPSVTSLETTSLTIPTSHPLFHNPFRLPSWPELPSNILLFMIWLLSSPTTRAWAFWEQGPVYLVGHCNLLSYAEPGTARCSRNTYWPKWLLQTG